MKKSIMLFSMLLLTVACGKQPEEIRATRISPISYQALNCRQIAEEARRVDIELARKGLKQREDAFYDNFIAFGVFPVFSGILSGTDEEIASLKGQKNALSEAWSQRDCSTRLQ